MGKRDGDVKQKKWTNDACFTVRLVKSQGQEGDPEYRSSQEAHKLGVHSEELGQGSECASDRKSSVVASRFIR